MSVGVPLKPSSRRHWASRARTIPVPEDIVPPYRFIRILDERVETLFRAVEASPCWSELHASHTPCERVTIVLREMLLSVHWYQSHTSEAEHLMLKRLPRRALRTVEHLYNRKTEARGYGRWALGDYLALGGDQKTAKMLPPDPTVFAVASVWWHLVQVEDTWACLGADYLFENLMSRVAQPVIETLRRRGISETELPFLVQHAVENAPHRYPIREVIVEAVTRFPDAEVSILRGFDYFRQVFPLPLWGLAYERTKEAVRQDYRDPWTSYVEGLNDEMRPVGDNAPDGQLSD
jgi:hypothetical protein